jgi:GntR family transcriptional regulator of gluconate operon
MTGWTDDSSDAGDATSPHKLPPINSRRTLVNDAADQLRQAVLSGRFRQGERLVETKIAGQLRVSRGTVRDAFSLLRAEGLLEEEPRRGTFVVSLSGRDARDIYELRAAVEGRAAFLVAKTGNPLSIGELRDLCTQMERAEVDHDAAGVYACDLAFHDALCRLSGNARLHEVFTRYVPALRALLTLDKAIYGPLEKIVGGHRLLVDAIQAGDAVKARVLAERHCDEAGLLATNFLLTIQDS